MRYAPSFVSSLGEARIEFNSNCYTDAYPLLATLWIRKLPVDLHAPTFALAGAILSSRYCGSVFEFGGVRLGEDYAEAIRIVLGRDVNVLNVDGLNRSLATAEQDVIASRAGRAIPATKSVDGTPIARVEWSGDFVDAATATSAGFFFGGVQTNALYFADEARVSVAMALLFGRDRCRDITIAADARTRKALVPVGDALRVVGISLSIV
jgi:hypothetical protein